LEIRTILDFGQFVRSKLGILGAERSVVGKKWGGGGKDWGVEESRKWVRKEEGGDVNERTEEGRM